MNPTKNADNHLSPKQSEALEMLRKHGKLIRKPGGYWTFPTAQKKLSYEGQPEMFQIWEWWAGTRTIVALLDRGEADRLEQLLPSLEGDGGGHIGSYREKTSAFIHGLRLAAANKEDVEFH